MTGNRAATVVARAPGRVKIISLLLVLGACLSCGDILPAANDGASRHGAGKNSPAWCTTNDRPQSNNAPPTKLAYSIVDRYPHRPDAYTQGLLFRDGYLYESTGRYGESNFARFKPGSSNVELLWQLPDDRFGEGLALLDDVFYLLTWKSGQVFRFALQAGDGIQDQGTQNNSGDGNPANNLNQAQNAKLNKSALAPLQLQGEGWGLTEDGRHLWSSDGSSTLSLRRASDLQLLRQLEVHMLGRPTQWLNELEWIEGCIVANIWRSDTLVVIRPDTGVVTHTLDLGAIARRERKLGGEATNGIALRHDNGHWLLTGKNWPHIYEISLQR
ncbi:MAG: hypothetical protein EX270_05050 [Pseudomonadales bacterium]|nr:MAG: hypothetical protein EX270_05050 [Pseudomonadales bacterium]